MSVSDFQINSVTHRSYVSVEEANNLLAIDPTLSETWAAASDDSKKIYLTAATRRIDLFDFIGEPVSESQPLKFPRTGDPRLPALPADANEASVFVPPGVELATALLAGTIATNPKASQANSDKTSPVISEVRAGSARVSFATREGALQIESLPLANETAYRHLLPYIASLTLSGDSTPGTGNLDTPRDERLLA